MQPFSTCKYHIHKSWFTSLTILYKIDLYETTENMTSFCTFHYFKLHYYPVIFQIPLPFVSFNNSNDQIHPHQWNSQSLFGLSSLRHHFSVLSHHNGRINTSFKSFRFTHYFVIMVICIIPRSLVVPIWLIRYPYTKLTVQTSFSCFMH